MCGICGFFNIKGFSKCDLENMNHYLTHRGPDDEGYYLNEKIALAQKRLSIVDLTSQGRQPMSDENHEIWVTFNGEIYNYIELRQQLKERGYSFRTNTDTEVIIYSYKEWGTDCFNKFIGMFAIGIWDSLKEKLVIVRDRVGIKPLYYYSNGDEFVFASELKPIVKYPNFEKNINNQAVNLYFTFGYIPAPYTIYDKVYKLIPGNYLEVKKGKVSTVKYWDPIAIKQKGMTEELSEEEYIEELDRLLKSSIKYRLISDVPVGAFLSGGVDSSTVAAIMSGLCEQKIKTFSIGFNNPQFNEAEHAKDIANYLGTEHTELYINNEDLFNLLDDLPYYYDEPFFDSSSIPTMLVSKLAKEKVSVALSGDGGDELFCGYKTYNHIKKLSYFDKLPKLIRNRIGALGGFYNEKIPQVLTYEKDISNMVFNLFSLFHKQKLQRVLLRYEEIDRDLTFFKTYDELKNYNILDRAMVSDIKTYMVDDILTKVDRASMKYALEARVPILDHRIIEFALKLPIKFKMKNNENKYLLKRVLEKYVPKELTNRPKKGFSVPLKEWVNGPLKEKIDYYLSYEYITKQKIFNYSAINEMRKNGELNHNQIWSLYIFQIWYEKYINNSSFM